MSHGVCPSCLEGVLERLTDEAVEAALIAVPEATAALHPDGRIVGVNPPMSTLFGVSNRGLRGQLMGDVLSCTIARDAGNCGGKPGCAPCPLAQLMRALAAGDRIGAATEGPVPVSQDPVWLRLRGQLVEDLFWVSIVE